MQKGPKAKNPKYNPDSLSTIKSSLFSIFNPIQTIVSLSLSPLSSLFSLLFLSLLACFLQRSKYFLKISLPFSLYFTLLLFLYCNISSLQHIHTYICIIIYIYKQKLEVVYGIIFIMMDANPQYTPRTVEEVFRDYKGRRAGLIKALTRGKFSYFRFGFQQQWVVVIWCYFFWVSCNFCPFFFLGLFFVSLVTFFWLTLLLL